MERALVVAIVVLAVSAVEAILVAAWKSRGIINTADPAERKRLMKCIWYQFFKSAIYLGVTSVLAAIWYNEH